jgi:hypothetical protein
VLLLGLLAVLYRSPVVLVCGALAIGLGFGLAGTYVVPAAFEQQWVNISAIFQFPPEENFLFTPTGHHVHDAFNLIISVIAVAEISITVVALTLSTRERRYWYEAWWCLLALASISVALILPITELAWEFLPFLRFVQFPWRWLLPFGVAFSFFVTIALARARRRAVWEVLLASLLVTIWGSAVYRAAVDPGAVSRLQQAMAQKDGYQGSYEYVPLGVSADKLVPRTPQVTTADGHAVEIHTQNCEAPTADKGTVSVCVDRWEAERKALTIDASQPMTLLLRLLSYPAWRVEVNHRVVPTKSAKVTGQISVPVPAGKSRVQVTFMRTADRIFGGELSLASLLICCGIVLGQRLRTAGRN